LSFIIYFKSI